MPFGYHDEEGHSIKVNTDDKKAGIYKITCVATNKHYIGSCVRSIRLRWADHRYRFKKGTNSRHLQRAWDKYGEENFEFSVLENVDDTHLLYTREQHWIDFYDACNPKYGYNLSPTAGSRLGCVTSEEGLQNLRACAALKRKKNFCVSCGEEIPYCKSRKHTKNKTCGKKDCIQKSRGCGGYSLQLANVENCPFCSNPCELKRNKRGYFERFNKTCGGKECISMLKSQSAIKVAESKGYIIRKI